MNLILDRWWYLSRVPVVNEVEISSTPKYKIADTYTLYYMNRKITLYQVEN